MDDDGQDDAASNAINHGEGLFLFDGWVASCFAEQKDHNAETENVRALVSPITGAYFELITQKIEITIDGTTFSIKIRLNFLFREGFFRSKIVALRYRYLPPE